MEIDSTNNGSSPITWPTGWTNVLAFRYDSSAAWQPIKTDKIVSIKKAFLPNAEYYKYTNRCSIKITMQDDTAINFDAQDVSNQATWNDGTEAELNNAINDLMSWV